MGVEASEKNSNFFRWVYRAQHLRGAVQQGYLGWAHHPAADPRPHDLQQRGHAEAAQPRARHGPPDPPAHQQTRLRAGASQVGEVLCREYRAWIFKLSRSPGIDSEKSIPTACEARRAGMTTPIPTRFLDPIDCLKTSALYCIWAAGLHSHVPSSYKGRIYLFTVSATRKK